MAPSSCLSDERTDSQYHDRHGLHAYGLFHDDVDVHVHEMYDPDLSYITRLQ